MFNERLFGKVSGIWIFRKFPWVILIISQDWEYLAPIIYQVPLVWNILEYGSPELSINHLGRKLRNNFLTTWGKFLN